MEESMHWGGVKLPAVRRMTIAAQLSYCGGGGGVRQ